ncbi:magnesium transporter, partial [Morganella morganii]
GLSPEEDVFAPVGQAVKNRWAWLAINLCTAFVASRVIGVFEHTISQLVALATLMPIVAGIGGNTGNQTITMIVRALALHQIQKGSFSFLLLRELGVAFINGVVWGGIMGVVTYLLYGDIAMGAVMTLAMVLNLLMAAIMGVLIPLTMMKLGRDPALGSSVMITAITDTGGFFIFLGLATLFLV